MFVTFNAYGVQHDAIARIIGAAIGYQHKTIKVDGDRDRLWLNCDAYVHWPVDVPAEDIPARASL